MTALYRVLLILTVHLLTGIACSAAEAIQYPMNIPDGCFALAQRKSYPTVIASRWEGVKARAKLARMKDSDPLVHQCRVAVAQAVAAHKQSKSGND
jgi:hypothetical protein